MAPKNLKKEFRCITACAQKTEQRHKGQVQSLLAELVLQATLSTPLLPLLKGTVLWSFNISTFTFVFFTAATCAKRRTSIQKCFIDIMDQLQGSTCDPCDSTPLAVRLE